MSRFITEARIKTARSSLLLAQKSKSKNWSRVMPNESIFDKRDDVSINDKRNSEKVWAMRGGSGGYRGYGGEKGSLKLDSVVPL